MIAPCFLHGISRCTLWQHIEPQVELRSPYAFELHVSVDRRPAQPRKTLHVSCVPPTGQCPRNAVCAYAPAADVENFKRDVDNAERMSQPSNPPSTGTGGPPSAASTARAVLGNSVQRAFDGRLPICYSVLMSHPLFVVLSFFISHPLTMPLGSIASSACIC